MPEAKEPTDPSMQAALDALVELLDLEELETNLSRGRIPDESRQRVFAATSTPRRGSW